MEPWVSKAREKQMVRSLLPIAIVGVLASLLAGGCTRSAKPPGGSTGSRAEQSRKNAEAVALNVVSGIANFHARTIPESKTATTVAPPSVTVITPNGNGKSQAPSQQAPSATRQISTTSSSPVMEPAPRVSASREAPKAAARSSSPVVIHERVESSIPYVKESEAEEDALSIARDAIEKRLAELDPPVHYRPTLHEIRTEFVRKDSRTIREQTEEQRKVFQKEGFDMTQKLVYIDYDVDVTADQIRELRTRDRVVLLLRFVTAFCCVSFAGFLFLRADEWTKGYLTRWLACAAVVLGGGAVAALCFV